jgi:hypothetical protein
MGYAGKVRLQDEARNLRSQGKSIKNIQQQLGVSKSSISLWVRDVILTQEQINTLYLNKKTGGFRGCLIAADHKRSKRLVETQAALEQGKKEVGKLLGRERFLVGIALYFAEGNKKGKNVAFTNSDDRAIKFMVLWFREFCKVEEAKFRVSLYIHNDLNEGKAKLYWSSLLNIPLTHFTKSYVVENNPNRLRHTRNENGVCRVTIHSISLLRKILGWISGIFEI